MTAIMALAINCESTGKPGVCDTHADVPAGQASAVAALVKASAGKKQKNKKQPAPAAKYVSMPRTKDTEEADLFLARAIQEGFRDRRP